MNLIHRYLYVKRLYRQLEIIKEWERKPDGVEALNQGASFFHLTQICFYNTILVELCMLLSDREERSIKHWLSEALENVEIIEPTLYSRDTGEREIIPSVQFKDIIDQHKARLEAQKETIQKMKGRRDQALVHLDEEYFDNPEKLFSDYPIHENEITSLLDTIDTILREQHLYLLESEVGIEVKSYSYAGPVLRYVKAFKRVRADKELIKKGVRPGIYLRDGLNWRDKED